MDTTTNKLIAGASAGGNSLVEGMAYDGGTGTTVIRKDNIQSGPEWYDSTGTTLLVCKPNEIYKYTLSTPFDASTATFTQQSSNLYDVSATAIANNTWYYASSGSIFAKPDGTKIYVTANRYDSSLGWIRGLTQLNLSTAFDLSTISVHHTITLSSSYAGGNDNLSFIIGDNGTKCWHVRYTQNEICRATMSTAWDLSTWSFVGNVSYASHIDANSYVHSISWNSTGTKFYVNCGGSGNYRGHLYEHSISSAWDPTPANITSTFKIPATFTEVNAIGNYWTMHYQANDNLIILNRSGGKANYRVDMPSGSLANFTYSAPASNSFYYRTHQYSWNSSTSYIRFNNDGTKLYQHVGQKLGGASGWTFYGINEYSLSTAYELTTASFTYHWNIYTASSSDHCISYLTADWIVWQPDGMAFYYCIRPCYSGKDIIKISLSTAWDLTTATYSSSDRVALGSSGNPFNLDYTYSHMFNSDGTKVYYHYAANWWATTLTTAYDLTTMSGTPVNMSGNATFQAAVFSPDGMKLIGNVYKSATSSYVWMDWDLPAPYTLPETNNAFTLTNSVGEWEGDPNRPWTKEPAYGVAISSNPDRMYTVDTYFGVIPFTY